MAKFQTDLTGNCYPTDYHWQYWHSNYAMAWVGVCNGPNHPYSLGRQPLAVWSPLHSPHMNVLLKI